MKKITRSATTLAVGLGLAGFLALGATLPAHADGGISPQVTLTGGQVTGGVLTPGNFTGINLGAGATATASWAISDVVDSTGTGNGWNISVVMTQLAAWSATTGGLTGDAAGYITDGHTLPTSSITVTTSPGVTEVGGDSITGVSGVALNTALDTGSAVELLKATAGNGVGEYAFSALGVTLTIPNNVYAGLYQTDATVSNNATP